MTTKNYFAYLLMFYIASTLVFAIGSNVTIAWFFNLLLLGSYVVYFLITSKKEIVIHKFLWFYIFFVIFSFASIFWSIDSSNTFFKSLNILIIAINIVIIYNISRYFKIENFILYGFLLGMVYNYAILFEVISYTSEYAVHFIHRFVGTTNNPNVIAVYLIFAIFSSLILLDNIQNKLFKLLLILNIPIALYGIINTASKKGIIFGLLLLIIYFIAKVKSKKSIIWILLLILVGYFIVDSGILLKVQGIDYLFHRLEVAESAFGRSNANGSTGQRIYMIQTAYEIFVRNFGTILFGTGQDTFSLQNKLGVYAHNNYMEILSNLGLIGFALFYSMHIVIIKNTISLKNEQIRYFFAGLILILMLMDNALVSYSFKPTLFIFIFMVIYIENNNKRVINE